MSNDHRISPDALPEAMTLYDDYVPGIGAGAYRLAAQQTVSFDGETHHYYRDQRFVVSGPRYALPENEIHTRFPPLDGVGDYATSLPHVVLRTRALPWERAIWTRGAPPPADAAPTPWIALLLLAQGELEDAASTLGRGPAGDNPLLTTSTPQSLQAAGGADGGVLLPLLGDELDGEDDKTKFRLLELPLPLFHQVCPREAELPFLAHVRAVDPVDKVPLDMPAVGDFAVLVGNRLPQVGINHVFLVSLEGLADVIDGTRQPPAGGNSVRLIALASWTFNNDAAGVETFGELLAGLDAGPLAVAAPPTSDTEGDADRYVARALANGYVPLRYQPYREEATFGWYRGPFTPRPVARLAADAPPFHRSDAALVVDPDTGLFDLSYATAFQFGRLATLATPTAAQALRRLIHFLHDAYAVADTLEQKLQVHGNAPAFAPAVPPLDDTLLQFLAELALLYPLPYEYCVPHEKLLPPEAIRFFYLDDNYVDALLEGALSVAQDCSRDRELADTWRRGLDSGLSQVVYQYRRRRQGLALGSDAHHAPHDDFLSVRKSGFLLRSAAVAGWPGLEVNAYDARGEKIPLLRLDHMADDLLLGLAPTTIQRLEIKEPGEGLRFGLDDEDEIMVRSLQPAQLGQPLLNNGVEVKVAGLRMRPASAAGVLDIVGLRQAISAAQQAHETTMPMGPAAFALQMLRSPEKQQFDTGTVS